MNAQEFVERYYVERKGTSSLKWDALDERFGDPDLISMWVADMEFRVPECVTDALRRRVDHGVYGYSLVPDSYYDAVIGWEARHHGYQVERDWIRITPGVVAALYWCVNMYTKPGDALIINTPVYYPFHNAVKDSGRRLVCCDLSYDDGHFAVDYDAFERAIVDNGVKMHILCSPHNPAGRVWTENELERVLEICARHDVLVVSDEIHQDLVAPGHAHIPTATVAGGTYADRVITTFASSKTFNLASCLTSTVVIPDEGMRRTWDAFTSVYHNVSTNVFGLTAVEAALRGGEDWYEGLKKLVWSNYQLLVDGFADVEGVRVAPLEGTYLAFVDLRERVPLDKVKEFTQDRCRVAVDYGEWFGKNWRGFIRLNLGTHPDNVRKVVENMRAALEC